MKVGPKSSLRPFLHRALQLLLILIFTFWLNTNVPTKMTRLDNFWVCDST